jgi:hypothetical protein
MKLKNSSDLLNRTINVIPTAMQNFSKSLSQWARGFSSAYLVRGHGAGVWDGDINKLWL